VDLNRKSLKKMFPNLAREVGSEENRVSVNSVRTNNEAGEKHASRGRFTNYMPDIIDFIRRCDTAAQAEEILVYMEKRGEIDEQYAKKLREQLKEKGVRSFGTKKEHDYYLTHGEC
jgi:hypothetical protein